jgi:hypothetical protein
LFVASQAKGIQHSNTQTTEDTMNGFVDVCNYQPSPRSTDPADIISEKELAIRWLRSELEAREATIAERERFIGELLREIVGAD